MKIIFILFYLLTSLNLNAQETFKFNYNSGTIYLGFTQSSNQYLTEISVDFVTLGIEHERTRLGLEYSPVKYWEFSYQDRGKEKINDTRWSFLNFRLYWNVFDFRVFDEMCNFFIGPFSTINYLMLAKDNGKYKVKGDNLIFSTGLRVGFNFNISEYSKYFIIGAESGYRIMNGKNSFFLTINLDLVVTGLVYVMSAFNQDD